MGNREIDRYTTRQYTSVEGVNVKEEHLDIALRRELPGRKLDAKDKCEFDLVTFDKPGQMPVFWVRESEWNQCSDKALQQYVDSTIVGEIRMSHGRLTPEDMTVFVERKNRKVNQFTYFTPALGVGKGECDRYPEEAASREAIDKACKENLGCKDNLPAQHLHEQDISKEELFDNKRGTKKPDAELWQKIRDLNQAAELEAGQQKIQEREIMDQEQEMSKKK